MKKSLFKKWGSTVLAGSLILNASPIAFAATTTTTVTAKTVTTGRTAQAQVTGIINPNPIPKRGNSQTVLLSGTVTIDGPKLGLKVNGIDVTSSAEIKKVSDKVWTYKYVATLNNVLNSVPGDETFTLDAYTMYQNGSPGGDIHTLARSVSQTVDLTAPQITFNHYDTNPTNQNIVVSAVVNDGILNTASHTFTENGSFEFTATDEAGNEARQTVTIDNIDKTEPKAIVGYSTTSPINTNVVATLNPTEDVTYTNVNELPDSIKFDQTAGTLTFSENGEFELQFSDKAGNKGSALVTVNNIDKTAPIGSVTYSIQDPTNQDVTVTLNTLEPITVTNNNGSLSKTFSKNGEFTFEFVDAAGNKGTADVNVSNIDKVAPTATVEYSTTKMTNGDVVVTINPSEDVTVLNNSGSLSRTFSENDDFQFLFVDKAGNPGYVDVSVNNIDTTPPVITVNPYNQDPTNQDVVVTVNTNEGSLNTASHTFTENGTFEFVATDEAGNRTTHTVQVSNIDKTAPVITVGDYNTNPTNQDITVSVSTNEGSLNTGSHTFTENGSYDFVATDAAGNVTTKTVTVSNIDKVAPVISVGDFTKNPTKEDITVNVTTNEGTLNQTSHTFSENGSFNFVAADAAGNVTTQMVTVSNIDKAAPIITVLTYNTDPTNQNVVVTASTNEGTLNETSYTFTENSTFTFVATDAAGNRTEYPVEITNIDKAAPLITVVEYNTNPTKQDVTVSVSTNEGTLNTSSHTFTTNGSFDFIAVDAAGNRTTRTVTISNIDKTPPAVTGITDGTAYKTNVTPSFTEGTATLNGSTFASGTSVIAEGNYALVVKDDAGNSTTVYFTIDKTAPVLSGVNNGDIINFNVTPVFNEGAATLNGSAFTSGTTVSKEGKYTLAVTDTAGNITSISFEVDKTAPNAPINVSAETPNGSIKVTTIKGNAETETIIKVYVRKNDGTKGDLIGSGTTDRNGAFNLTTNPYQNNNTWLLVTATDKAGNTSQTAAVQVK